VNTGSSGTVRATALNSSGLPSEAPAVLLAVGTTPVVGVRGALLSASVRPLTLRAQVANGLATFVNLYMNTPGAALQRCARCRVLIMIVAGAGNYSLEAELRVTQNEVETRLYAYSQVSRALVRPAASRCSCADGVRAVCCVLFGCILSACVRACVRACACACAQNFSILVGPLDRYRILEPLSVVANAGDLLPVQPKLAFYDAGAA
jgi:hypothetical protein